LLFAALVELMCSRDLLGTRYNCDGQRGWRPIVRQTIMRTIMRAKSRA
jgi:hypothetical protein